MMVAAPGELDTGPRLSAIQAGVAPVVFKPFPVRLYIELLLQHQVLASNSQPRADTSIIIDSCCACGHRER